MACRRPAPATVDASRGHSDTERIEISTESNEILSNIDQEEKHRIQRPEPDRKEQSRRLVKQEGRSRSPGPCRSKGDGKDEAEFEE